MRNEEAFRFSMFRDKNLVTALSKSCPMTRSTTAQLDIFLTCHSTVKLSQAKQEPSRETFRLKMDGWMDGWMDGQRHKYRYTPPEWATNIWTLGAILTYFKKKFVQIRPLLAELSMFKSGSHFKFFFYL